MESISGLLLGFCACGVIGGLVHLLVPNGTTEKAFRLIVTLFMLSCVFAPLRSLQRESLWDGALAQESLAVHVQSAVTQTAERAIEETTKQVLTQHGLPDARAEISMQIVQGEVHTKRFTLYGVPMEKAQEIADEIFAHTGERPTVESTATATGIE